MVSEVGMTRAPVVEFDSALEVMQMRNWLENEENFNLIKKEFESTSKYAMHLLVSIDEMPVSDMLNCVRFELCKTAKWPSFGSWP